ELRRLPCRGRSDAITRGGCGAGIDFPGKPLSGQVRPERGLWRALRSRNTRKKERVMAMLKKTFLAAVACGTIAFTASAFAQAGVGAGGMGAGPGAATPSVSSGLTTNGTSSTTIGRSNVTGPATGTLNGTTRINNRIGSKTSTN